METKTNKYSLFLYSMALILFEIFIFEIVIGSKDITTYSFNLNVGILFTIILISITTVLFASKDYINIKEKILNNKLLLAILVIAFAVLITLFIVYLNINIIYLSTFWLLAFIGIIYLLGRILEKFLK